VPKDAWFYLGVLAVVKDHRQYCGFDSYAEPDERFIFVLRICHARYRDNQACEKLAWFELFAHQHRDDRWNVSFIFNRLFHLPGRVQA